MSIEYIPYKNIDKEKWDACIKNAINGLIYAQSFYLDNMSENWDALILNDYEAVMPLTWKKKWGIPYLYQPAFIQQGGIFFKEKISGEVIQSFISMAFARFRFAEITFNYTNLNFKPSVYFKITERNNYIISLNKPYQELYKTYHPHFTKSLRRIKKLDLCYTCSIDFTAAIELHKELYLKKINSISGKDLLGFKNICGKFLKNGNLLIRQAHSQNGKLLATVLLLKDTKRLYNIISCITKEGKKKEANYFLYDKLIEEFSNSALLLDMEGSDRKGIADFYKKLSPVNQPYPFIKYNNLHPVVKLFKQ